ncbi:hypothetical protein GCM10023175_29610 [Pseudonocardia xishanensis]|uniref:LysR substrate binding domain-containing protein n=1 Tax=Pseudonocardia xishanensis TaxID=630995 RepID=A0ABP8RSK5_9PSEU
MESRGWNPGHDDLALRLEDLVRAPQLGILGAQPPQLGRRIITVPDRAGPGIGLALGGLDPIPDRRRVDVQQLTDVSARGQLRLAVITQTVLVEADRAGTGLLIELPRCSHSSSLLARSGASPPARTVQHDRQRSAGRPG